MAAAASTDPLPDSVLESCTLCPGMHRRHSAYCPNDPAHARTDSLLAQMEFEGQKGRRLLGTLAREGVDG